MGSYTGTKKERSGEGMRYIAIWKYKDYNPESVKKQLAIHNERGKKGEQVKSLLPPHSFLSEPGGFTIFETENEAEIVKYCRDYSPVLNVKVIPIVESMKFVELFK